MTYRRDKLVLSLVGRSVMAVGWDLQFLQFLHVASPCGWVGLLRSQGSWIFFSGSWLSPEQRSGSLLASYRESLELAQGPFCHFYRPGHVRAPAQVQEEGSTPGLGCGSCASLTATQVTVFRNLRIIRVQFSGL